MITEIQYDDDDDDDYTNKDVYNGAPIGKLEPLSFWALGASVVGLAVASVWTTRCSFTACPVWTPQT